MKKLNYNGTSTIVMIVLILVLLVSLSFVYVVTNNYLNYEEIKPTNETSTPIGYFTIETSCSYHPSIATEDFLSKYQIESIEVKEISLGKPTIDLFKMDDLNPFKSNPTATLSLKVTYPSGDTATSIQIVEMDVSGDVGSLVSIDYEFYPIMFYQMGKHIVEITFTMNDYTVISNEEVLINNQSLI